MLLGDPIDAEQNLGDFALAGAMPAGVDGAQHRLEPSSLLGRHALVAWNPVACQVPQQAVGGGNAVETVRVDRYRDRQRIVGLDRGVGDQMQAGTDLAQQEMEFLRRDPHLAGEEGAQGCAAFARRNKTAGKAQDGGIDRFAPENGLVKAREAWPGREIVTPSGAPSVRAAADRGGRLP